MTVSRWESAKADGATIEPLKGKPATQKSLKAAQRSAEINVADEVIDGLWVGSVQAGEMASRGLGEFDVIVNVTGENTDWAPKMGHNKSYVHFQFSDGDLPDLDHLDALVEYIAALFTFQTTGKQRKVLIHCTMGVNRSGLITALVVRRIKGLSGLEALRLVREKRDLHGNSFYSPGTKETGDVAVFNSKFSKYIESLA